MGPHSALPLYVAGEYRRRGVELESKKSNATEVSDGVAMGGSGRSELTYIVNVVLLAQHHPSPCALRSLPLLSCCVVCCGVSTHARPPLLEKWCRCRRGDRQWRSGGECRVRQEVEAGSRVGPKGWLVGFGVAFETARPVKCRRRFSPPKRQGVVAGTMDSGNKALAYSSGRFTGLKDV